ncbi:bromodomain and WD repeat-containing protein 3-like [Sorghum bicolor]|uniref:bromodomain and WD repeat-containing protein 3-like n=1 Tax=Sorghum bicolor TaxID=4558 RepID=UPI000B423CA5|nr:bromodomain and WD repeat-containing protein 3-like [Sorghum bicolor]|eukprot:XP_021317484.1 bromodomain and WD repeat-containing protein 3-like [Sorghum bicolor]
MVLATASKGSSTLSEYFVKMKALGDDMALAGRRLEDEELVSYILTGLDENYEAVVSTVSARVESISVSELYTQLMSFESRKEMKNAGSNSSVNTATRGGNGGNSFGGRNGGGHGGGRGNGRGGGRGGRGPNFQAGVVSQLCGKEGHAVVDCWKRFDQSWTGPPRKSMSSTTTSYGVDTNWYMDTGATDHVTGELEKLTMRDKYNGHEQVHTASGSGPGHEEDGAGRQV